MTSALVIGAGIAGPVAAMAMQRAGIEVTVHEARPAGLAEEGTWLTIASNGLDALAAIDAHKVATLTGFPTPSNRLMSRAGTPLRTFAIGRPLADGTVSHTVKRARLARALREEAESRGIAIHRGHALVSAMVTDDGRAAATFADGTTATADVLIGCDGIRSVVRHAIDSTAPPPRYVDMVNYGGYVPAAEATDLPPDDPGVWHMIYGEHAFFGHVADRQGNVVWFANLPGPQITRESRASTDEATWRRLLAEAFAGDPSPAASLVTRGVLEVAGDNVFDHPATPRWQNGSLVVIGDAAHAPSSISGQGAGLAIEDAVVLAKCLRDVQPVARALARYEGIRRVRVERMVEQEARGLTNKVPGRIAFGAIPFAAPLLQRSATLRHLESATRDLALRVVYRWFITQSTVQWSYDHHIDWAERIDDHHIDGAERIATAPVQAA